MSDARRTSLRESIATHLHSIRIALAEVNTIQEGATPDVVRLQKLSEDIDTSSLNIDHAWLRMGLVWVDNFSIDDKPATAESMISDGPINLYNEIVAAVKRASTLSESEQGESEPPSTSGAQVDGGTNPTGADTAGNVVCISRGIADEPILDTAS
jgi:hypothetical protein